MELVYDYGEMKRNLSTIDTYAIDLIKRGTCFLVLVTDDGYKFYPSRFIGYKENTMKNHLNNEDKDGRETNPHISAILGIELEKSQQLEMEYVKYCEKLGFIAREKGSFGVERKFWLIK